MGGSYGKYGAEERYIEVRWKNLNERDHLENLDVDGSIILKCILKELFGCVD